MHRYTLKLTQGQADDLHCILMEAHENAMDEMEEAASHYAHCNMNTVLMPNHDAACFLHAATDAAKTHYLAACKQVKTTEELLSLLAQFCDPLPPPGPKS